MSTFELSPFEGFWADKPPHGTCRHPVHWWGGDRTAGEGSPEPLPAEVHRTTVVIGGKRDAISVIAFVKQEVNLFPHHFYMHFAVFGIRNII